MKKCKYCKSPIGNRYKVCGTCNGLREDAFRRATSHYKAIMSVFVLLERETPQMLHYRVDGLIGRYAATETGKRKRWERRFQTCEVCEKRWEHEVWCDYYVPPEPKRRRKH